jgi:acylphosphatase
VFLAVFNDTTSLLNLQVISIFFFLYAIFVNRNFPNSLKTMRIIISGKVQGVYYRQSTREKSMQLGISGIVKNLTNGSVELIASGTADQLNNLIEWCKQGPPKAVVSSIEFEELPYQTFDGFKIIRL